jgi:hypothetical protein
MRGAAEFEVVLIKIWLLRPLSLYRGMIRLESRVGPALQFEGGYRGLDEQVKFPWPSYESSDVCSQRTLDVNRRNVWTAVAEEGRTCVDEGAG